MAAHEYECPACAGVMEFDASLQKLKCQFCDTVISVDEYKKMVSKKESESANHAPGGFHDQMTAEDADNAGFGEDKNVYLCQSCGGEIIADKTQGAATCPFCGNNVTFKEVFTKGRKPDYIIPFKLTKQQAKDKYREYAKSKKLVPKAFTNESHIDEIKGVYIPYWLFDASAQGHLDAECTKVRTWSDKDYAYTETSHYSVSRDGNESFTMVPVDGSSHMPDELTEAIEPFNKEGLVAYDEAYLAGYVANQYDVSEAECAKRARQRITNSFSSDMRASVSGYSSVHVVNNTINIDEKKVNYALYPVWLLNTTYKGQRYLFAMNGQTGKFIGDLPADEGLVKKYYFIYAGIAALAMIIFEMIFKI
ncbi:hypothetical protein [Butyrivibrio sp. MC2013]|uniref:hypothetical protein n=1 Tax=Butyrivibrio sp. MC2013 TaxID=1280686 RepID=UPI0003FA6436|nr:hypothetical protein [Butyrivibrio sp. MC2013]